MTYESKKNEYEKISYSYFSYACQEKVPVIWYACKKRKGEKTWDQFLKLLCSCALGFLGRSTSLKPTKQKPPREQVFPSSFWSSQDTLQASVQSWSTDRSITYWLLTFLTWQLFLSTFLCISETCNMIKEDSKTRRMHYVWRSTEKIRNIKQTLTDRKSVV